MNILDLVFPKICLECKKEGRCICRNCLAKVQLLKSVCPYCEKASIDGFTHIKCKKKYGLDGLISVWRYDGVVKKAISSLKYKYATEIVRELCGYFVPELRNSLFVIPKSSVLMPIPIYWYRQNFRGFNQSEEIGKIVAKEIGLIYDQNLLIRIKSVKPQAGLTVAERKNNLRGVFSLSPHNSSFLIHNSIVLFDDVFTTGSTLHEACKVLKRHGATKVWGMTICR